MSLLIEYSQVLQDFQFSTALRESIYMFPIVEGLHLLGLAFSVGLIVFTDLRLVGKFLRNEPVSDILFQLRPWVLSGFAITFITGFFLFAANAVKLLESQVFLLKIFLIVLAGINAVWFELRLGRKASEWVGLSELPEGVVLAGWISLILWTGVVITGRMIPYLG
ncbi:hypothetical protein MTYP_02227 [Methylophilaceae bacterium]|nr:hypothetical protein MTYP_02227 [Methylophilaceae bacterium]